jgi:uncharacterized membrane protein (UPF0182 family)
MRQMRFPSRMPTRRSRRRGLIIAILLLLIVLALFFSRFYTDVLWFREVGLTSVLFKTLWTQFFVGVAVAVLVAVIVWVNLVIAARIGPTYRIPPMEGGRADPMDQYREVLRPYMRWVRLGVALLVGVLAGAGATSAWQNFLLYVNRVGFGVSDPQFERDVGFYVFELPFLKDVTGYLWFAFVAATLLTIAAHYLNGSIRPDIGLRGITPSVLAHISVLLGCLALIKAAQYYLGTFELNFSPRGTVTGASYTDVNAQLPALRLLGVISIISAILFLVNIRVRRLALPIAAVGIWILTSVLAGGLWPAIVQRFSVAPQELEREREYIDRNLEATRAAFGLGEVDSQDFLALSTLTEEDATANEVLLQNVRLWDPSILQRAYRQLQAIRSYYQFADVDIDRYEVDGELRQVLLSARELSLDDLPPESRNWANEHLQYTHGYGIVASLANETTGAGEPDFIVQDIPGTVESGAEALEAEQRGIYFGESFEPDEYSVVNTGQAEIDYEDEDGEVQRSNYEGEGGVQMGNIFRRFAFALREFDPNLLISGLINSDSRIMLYRNVRDRVLRAAPFLALDHDPYPAIVDGRGVWILDAYTSTPWYPYSQRFQLSDIIDQDQSGTLSGESNYVRNSVKVVVDAYDGTMDFYIIEDDPLIEAWAKAFPDLFTTEEPSAELQEHFRYPEDLFKIQSDVFLTYHMESADDFYSRVDAWEVPSEASGENGAIAANEAGVVQPTYLLISLPDSPEQEFVLTRPFTPRGRNNMVAFMVARSDPGSYGEILTLEFPRSRQVDGPLQINNIINQDVEVSQAITLLSRGGSNVEFGSLVVLPIEDSILYVQPLVVTAVDEGIPEVKRVILVLGEEVVMEETFDEALASLLGLEPPPVAEEPGEEPPPEEPGGEEPPPEEPAGNLAGTIEEASRVYAQAQEALQAGDFERYGRLIERLGELIDEAQQQSSGGG